MQAFDLILGELVPSATGKYCLTEDHKKLAGHLYSLIGPIQEAIHGLTAAEKEILKIIAAEREE